MRVLGFVFAVVFLVLAFYETGGQHPVMWILVFGTMALLSVLAMFRIYFKMLPAAIGLLAATGLLLHWADVHLAITNQNPAYWWHILATRYTFYAVLCMVAATIFLVNAFRQRRHFKRLQNKPGPH
jgi:hypothetical protein